MLAPSPCQQHIFVIEDDLPTREMLALMLRCDGYRVSTAVDGQAALEQLRQGDLPQLILLDLMMPRMDGWEFRGQQRRDPQLAEIPVIVCTASGRSQQSAAELEAVAYFDKPVDPFDLLTAIHRVCPRA